MEGPGAVTRSIAEISSLLVRGGWIRGSVTTPDWPSRQPTLEGDGVRLRPWMASDAQDVLEACQDPEIQLRTTVPVPYLHDHAIEFVTRTAPQQWTARVGALFCVTSLGDERLLGSCGLVAVHADSGIAELGYWIAPSARGERVAQRAVGLLSSWALGAGGLRRLELQVEPDNLASRAVAERAGCIREGTIERHLPDRSAGVEHVIYVLTR